MSYPLHVPATLSRHAQLELGLLTRWRGYRRRAAARGRPSICGKQVAIEDRSYFSTSTGNEAATQAFKKGVATSVIKGKAISSRAIEKATGGKNGGGCDRKDIQKQLDEQFKAHNDTLLRGVKDSRRVTDAIKNAVTRKDGDI